MITDVGHGRMGNDLGDFNRSTVFPAIWPS